MDGNGEIGPEDLMLKMNDLGHEMDIEYAKDMIHTFDFDSDGTISFLEFVQFMMYDTQDQQLFDQIGEKPSNE